MPTYNLNSLLHRSLTIPTTMPDGSVLVGTYNVDYTILIPKIQRDYAEGRPVESIERKRRNLLNDMLDVVYGTRPDLPFDFVYGYQDGQNHFFLPLDGQQRLTTLFLLHWLFGRKNDVAKGGNSLLVYETRDTSEEFCHWLVNQDEQTIVNGWVDETRQAKTINEENQKKWNTKKNDAGVVDKTANRLRFPLVPVRSLCEYMQSMDSFKWDWHDDPNIRSMITVLESTINLIHERGLGYSDAKGANLDNIKFMLLDNLKCDGDRLFEKMNARGKPLTSFEVLKSSLEEEMERQDLPNNSANFADDWRKAIDINWIDFCWDRTNVGAAPTLAKVREVETALERLITRMAEKSLYLTDIYSTKSTQPDAVDYGNLLAHAAQGKEPNKVFDRYFDYARHERAVNNQNLSTLDFKSIYDDINNLICKDSNGKWRDASSLLPKLNRDNDRTLLDEFLKDKPTHNTRVMMYAMLAYLQIVPASAIVTDQMEKSNFVDWMRFIRNVYDANNKTARLDNFDDVKAALKAINEWLGEYKKNYRTGNPMDVLRLVYQHIHTHHYGQEGDRIEEEAIKANLRLNGTPGVSAADWETSILKAEDNYYLWGQIIAPLSWAKVNGKYDKAVFDEYARLLDKWFGTETHEGESLDALLVQAMLCYGDYRFNLRNGLGSLGLLTDARDHSWKRHLRDEDKNSGLYGKLFKNILDMWRNYPDLSVDGLLRQEISNNKVKLTRSDWRYYIVNISDPQALIGLFNYTTADRYVYAEPNGHAYIFKARTFRTETRYELLTCYLAYEHSLLAAGVKAGAPAPTNDRDGAHIDFAMPSGDAIRLSVADGALYDISTKPGGTGNWQPLLTGITAADVATELKALNVIKVETNA